MASILVPPVSSTDECSPLAPNPSGHSSASWTTWKAMSSSPSSDKPHTALHPFEKLVIRPPRPVENHSEGLSHRPQRRPQSRHKGGLPRGTGSQAEASEGSCHDRCPPLLTLSRVENSCPFCPHTTQLYPQETEPKLWLLR